MEILKFGKFATLAMALSLAVGCSSKVSENTSKGASFELNTGHSADTGTIYVPVNEEATSRAISRAITTLYFEFDSSYLKPEAMRALDVHAKDLKANGTCVVLEGNTDERGTREYNMALGERRAKAVQSYLMLQGVSPVQLELVSYGEERPVDTGHSEQHWSQNRRVELRK